MLLLELAIGVIPEQIQLPRGIRSEQKEHNEHDEPNEHKSWVEGVA